MFFLFVCVCVVSFLFGGGGGLGLQEFRELREWSLGFLRSLGRFRV